MLPAPTPVLSNGLPHRHGTVSFHLYQLLLPAAVKPCGAHPATVPDGMDFMDTNGVSAVRTLQKRYEVCILLHADREIRLTPGEHFALQCACNVLTMR